MNTIINTNASFSKFILITILCCGSIFAKDLNAQKTKFTTAVRVSDASTSWHNPEMWNCKCVPNAEQDVIIAGYTVNIEENAVAKSLSLTNGAHDATLNVMAEASLNIINDLNLQTNTKSIFGSVVQTEGAANITVGGNVNLSRPEQYDMAGKLQLALNGNSTMAVEGGINIVATGSSVEEDNSEIRITGNAQLTVNSDLNISSTGTTKGVEVEMLSGAGSSPTFNILNNIEANSNSTGALKFDIKAQGVLSVANDAIFNATGAETDFKLLVGEAGANASFSTGGRLAITTESNLESKLSVRGASTVLVNGDLELNMDKTATKLTMDLGEFGGSPLVDVKGKVATLNSSTGELLADVRGGATLQVEGNFELKGLEGSAETMTKVRVRSAAKAVLQQNVKMLALAPATNIEFNVEENAEATVMENVEMEAMATGKVRFALKSQAKLMVAKNFIRPSLYGSLEMESDSKLVLNGSECGQEVPASQLIPSGDKFDISRLELANTSVCGISLEATPFKRTQVKRIKLVEGLVNLNAQNLLVTDSDPEAIEVVDGCFLGDGYNDFASKLTWDLGQVGERYTYPLCNEDKELLPITVTPTCDMGRTTVATYNTVTSNTPNNTPLPAGYSLFDYNGEEVSSQFVDRYYCIEPGNVHEGCAIVELGYTETDIQNNPDLNEDEIKVHHLSEWGLSEGRGEKIDGMSAEFRLLPGENIRYTLGSVIAPSLPVKFTGFKAVKKGQETQLEWTTASEVNNDYFMVERRVEDKTEWLPVARVKGAGTTTEENTYLAHDPTPVKGTNYYRIVQVDYNGKISYSEIRNLNFDNSIHQQVQIAPNPFNASQGVLNVEFQGLDKEDDVIIELYNSVGKFVRKQNCSNENNQHIDMSGVGTGMYYVKVVSRNGFQKTIPLVVQ